MYFCAKSYDTRPNNDMSACFSSLFDALKLMPESRMGTSSEAEPVELEVRYQ